MSAVRLRWFVTMSTVLAAAVALTVLVSQGMERGSDGDDQVVGGAVSTTTAPPATTTSSRPLPAAGSVAVTGPVTALHVEAGVLEPRAVPTPLTVSANAGFGNGGRLTGVLVDGTKATIEWDAGRPFVLSSGGALVLDPVRVDLTAEGLRLNLADAVHRLTPGTYRLDTPVAVGTSGVAAARESVVFDADAESTFEARGDAALFLGEGPRRLLGPGTVQVEGTFEVTGPDGTRQASRLDMAEGAFDLTLSPAAGGGWTVAARLGGEVTAT